MSPLVNGRLRGENGEVDRVSVNLGRVDRLACLGDLFVDGLELEAARYDLGSLCVERDFVRVDAIELLDGAVNSTRAAAAAHGDVELVSVRHVDDCAREGEARLISPGLVGRSGVEGEVRELDLKYQKRMRIRRADEYLVGRGSKELI
jgi:hypothetical protein